MRSFSSTRARATYGIIAVAMLAPIAVLAAGTTGLDATAGAAGIAGIGGGSIDSIVARVIRYVLGLTGIIFMCLTIYAGFLWMTSAGAEDKVTKAKQIIIAGIIGLVIVTGAYYITEAVFQAYGSAATVDAAP